MWLSAPGRLATRLGRGTEGATFTYRLFTSEGDELGQETDALMIQPGAEIITGENQRFRVLELVALGDRSPFVGLLQVEAV